MNRFIRGGKAIARRCTDILLPPACEVCGDYITAHSALCPACWSQIAFITKPCCDLCGLPLAYDIGETIKCGDCLAQPPDFDRARAAVLYGDVSKKLLMRYKHGDALEISGLFRKWLRFAYDELESESDIIAVVPLHWQRLLKRRYNQAALLAMEWGERKPAAYLPDLLHRTRATASQGHLSVRERQRNVKGAFAINPRYRDTIRGKSILLVDDVYTTGATLNACARTLKAAGAKQVYALTLARVMRD